MEMVFEELKRKEVIDLPANIAKIFSLDKHGEEILEKLLEKKAFKSNIEELKRSQLTNRKVLVTYDDFTSKQMKSKAIKKMERLGLITHEIMKMKSTTGEEKKAMFFYFPFNSFKDFWELKMKEIEFYAEKYKKYFEDMDQQLNVK
jgi:hypothetical protein